MATQKSVFTCSHCDAQYPKWSGRCLECGKWGTVSEGADQGSKSKPKNSMFKAQTSEIKIDEGSLLKFSEVSKQAIPRTKTNLSELDQVFGGGIVPGSLILLGGEPGVGKSTLMLQILKSLDGGPTGGLLYVSGEESPQQVKLRADRLNYDAKVLQLFAETNIEQIIGAIQKVKPALAIIDSIQTVYSSEVESEAGSVTQIRACTVKLLQVAKSLHVPIIITGHVTKDGNVAGPKTLEHLVDVVLYLEGDKYQGYRVLRSVKNRFGSTNEIALFEMTGAGLTEVKNPSKAFLQPLAEPIAGSVISAVAEGTRAFLVEIQALVSPTVFGYPQRKCSGYDTNRLQMLSAVMTKRANMNVTNQDIHLNVVGGFKTKEPAIDLAVCAAIMSAMKNVAINRQTVIIGEVGLGGEVRSVPNLDLRLKEAEKLNFQQAIIPNVKTPATGNLELSKIRKISDILQQS